MLILFAREKWDGANCWSRRAVVEFIRCSRALEIIPLHAELTNGSADRAQLQVGASPVGHDGHSIGRGIEPLSMRTVPCPGEFATAQRRELLDDLAVLQGTATTISAQTGPDGSAINKFGGSGLPVSR